MNPRTSFIAAAVVLLLSLGGFTVSAQPRESNISGVYALSRVVTTSTCSSTSTGDVSTAIYLIDYDSGTRKFGVRVLGATMFVDLIGAWSGAEVIFTSSALEATLSTALRFSVARVSGIETVNVIEGGSPGAFMRAAVAGRPCSIVRTVSGRRIDR